MPRIVLPLAVWQAIARELAGSHTAAAPPGLRERIQALLAQAPQAWPEQILALELDSSSAEAVRSVEASLTGDGPGDGQRAASVVEAIRIIHDHQQRG
jgi:hypothetical protein